MSEPLLPVWLSAWGLVLAVPLSAVLSLLSALLERSGPIRLRHWAEEASGGLRRLYDRPSSFEAFRFVINLAAKVLPLVTVALLGSLMAPRTPKGWWIALAAVAALVILAEWGNRWLIELHSESALRASTSILRGARVVAAPLVWLLSPLVPVAEASEEEEDEASEQEINAYIDVGVREGILEPEEEELVRSVVDFGDTLVRSVMTPRVEVKSVPSDISLEDLAKVFLESKHARLPVHERSIDQIVGIVHIRDVFEALHGGAEADVVSLTNPPHYVPESKPLPDLLEELQERQQQMAIVVDEYGGVAGLVTMEDLVEEIVGEIADEHERPRRNRVRLDGGRWRVRGRIPLEDLGELVQLDVDPGELPYETVSGLICGELGYVPKAGESVSAHGLELVIEEADERRVVTVTVGRAAAATTEVNA